jgi:NAD kinase
VEMEGFIPRLLSGRYETDRRVLLDVRLSRRNGRVHRSVAVNDCIVHIGDSLRQVRSLRK